MAELESLGTMLRTRRLSARLTIEDLAARSGVSVRAIGNMERGVSRSPQRATLSEIADALGLDDDARAAFYAAARSVRTGSVDVAPVRCALPRGVLDFTGRALERMTLTEFCRAAAGPGAVVLSGQAGVGKTSLAVRIATELVDDFPDGRFFVDLQGLTETPTDPSWVLEQLVLAIDPAHTPLSGEVADRAAVFREVLAGRRVLIVLDNAADEAQVRPLLPAAGMNRVVVTSRRRLAGLDGAGHVLLEPMAESDAAVLLAAILSAAGTRLEAINIKEIAGWCAGLPLAVRIAGNRIASYPEVAAGDVLERLRDGTRRLGALSAGDQRIRAAFDTSYGVLSPPGQRLFRRCALVPGPDFGVSVAARLAGEAIEVAETLLDELVDLGLLQTGFTGRYRQHDLLRLFAAAQLATEETPEARRAVQADLHSWLLAAAVAASQHWSPDQPSSVNPVAEPAILDTLEQAHNWLLGERANWELALHATATAGEHRRVIKFVDALEWFFAPQFMESWVSIYAASVRSAEILDDPVATARQLTFLAVARMNTDRNYTQIMTIIERALALSQTVHDDGLKNVVEQAAGLLYRRLGDTKRAETHLLAAQSAARRAGDWIELTQILAALADALRFVEGRTADARRYAMESMQLAADHKTLLQPEVVRNTSITGLTAIGFSWLTDQRPDLALESFQEAMALIRTTDSPIHRAIIGFGHGRALVEIGSVKEGIILLHRALTITEQLGPEALRKDIADHIEIYNAASTSD